MLTVLLSCGRGCAQLAAGFLCLPCLWTAVRDTWGHTHSLGDRNLSLQCGSQGSFPLQYEPVRHPFTAECRQSSLVHLGCGADGNKATGDFRVQAAASRGSGVSVGVCVSLRPLLVAVAHFKKITFGGGVQLEHMPGNCPSVTRQPPRHHVATTPTSFDSPALLCLLSF